MSGAAALLSQAEDLLLDGEHDAGLVAAVAALAELDASGEPDSALRGHAYHVVAQGHHHLENLTAAASFADRAVALFEAAPSHGADLAHALYGRAAIHLSAGEVPLAFPLLLRAAALYESSPRELISFGGVLATMAEVAHHQGELDDAIALFQRVLAAIDATAAESHADAGALEALCARAFMGLGSVAAQRGNIADAKDYLSRAVELFDAAFGHGHPAMIAALGDIAGIYRAIGEDDSAATIEEELAVAARMLAEAEADLDP